MGLYDTLRITSGPLKGEYQTKSLDSGMDSYVLGADARLMLEVPTWEDVVIPADELAELRARKEENAFSILHHGLFTDLELGTRSVVTGHELEPSTHTGDVHAYTSNADEDVLLTLKAGVCVALRPAAEGPHWDAIATGPSVAPAKPGPVTLVVGVTAAELSAYFPSAHATDL